MRRALLFWSIVCLLHARGAFAQGAPGPATPAGPVAAGEPCGIGGGILGGLGLESASADVTEQVAAGHHQWRGRAALKLCGGTEFSADQVDIFTETKRILARGNVVFRNPEGRLAAESADLNLETTQGTFYHASGIMSLGANVDRAQFGNQEPDVYFYGETIERLGARRYRITRGGFSTCVQPTPRWEVTTGSLVLNLNQHAIARNTVLKVKGVPVLYLPMLYYPMKDGERATGFLLPSYGASTLRGQSLSNAFFWAISRSQDATFFHDWFTRAGQGEGAEYRYVAGPQSSGNLRVYRFHQREATYENNGVATVRGRSNAFEITGVATHPLTPRIRARARVDYFSDVISQQLYHQDIYQASRSTRVIDGGVTASLGRVSLGAQYLRNELIQSTTETLVYGGTPRANATVAPQRLFNSPIYASFGSEYAFLPYRRVVGGRVVLDNSFNRFDAMPTLRMPLSRLTYLSVNTSAAFRTTYYSRSRDTTGVMTSQPFVRNYASLRTDVVGPVLTRIWDMAGSSAAERLKHVIEPTFSVDLASPIGNFRRTPVLTDVSDVVVGGSAQVTYGVTNRLLYRGATVDGVRGQTREFVTAGIQQTYYTNPESRLYDLAYVSNVNAQRVGDLSPVALTVRVSPSNVVDSNTRIEYDVSGRGLQSFTTGTNLNFTPASVAVNYSRQRVSDSSYLTGSTRLRLLEGRVTGAYALSWDLGRGYVVSQSISASHMAQCCGYQVEFQQYNFPSGSIYPVSTDRRFNIGIVLAGLGTFSNFFGAFGGGITR